jgi:Lrp/AsnC family transcriptional regulator for asnA, asnC and gidA
MNNILDEVDRQIIAVLQRNGRVSNVEIARELGLAEATVRKRMERLLAKGAIRVVAVTNPDRLGYTTRVFIGIETNLGQVEMLAERLAAIPEICSVSIVTGTYDVMIEVVLPSSDNLLSFLLDQVAVLPGVKRTETCHVLKTIKRACEWVIPDESLARSAFECQNHPSSSDEVIPGTIIIPS